LAFFLDYLTSIIFHALYSQITLFFSFVFVGTAKYTKSGRTGNKAATKRPSPGRRVVLQWSPYPHAPIGEWATRFNNMVGCLVKRADFINPYYTFHENPFSSFVEIWRELMVINFVLFIYYL
jgi:hypothetical protein